MASAAAPALRYGKLSDLAAMGFASEPTLRKWLTAEPDQPWILKRGKNGDAYELDLVGAHQAWVTKEESAAQAARDRTASLQQLAMDLNITSRSQPPGLELSIAERRQLLEEEIVAMKLSKLRGELVDRLGVEVAIGDMLVMFRQRLQTFGGRLAKKMDFSREQLAAIERQMTVDLATLADALERMELGSGDDGDSGADTAGTPLETAAAA